MAILAGAVKSPDPLIEPRLEELSVQFTVAELHAPCPDTANCWISEG